MRSRDRMWFLPKAATARQARSRWEISITRARLRELFDQRVGRGPVRGVEIGVPLVEQIDCRVGVCDDLLQRLNLALARGEAAAAALARARILLLLVEVIRVVRAGLDGEAEGEAVGGRPIIGAVLDLRLERGEQRRLARAIAAAHLHAPVPPSRAASRIASSTTSTHWRRSSSRRTSRSNLMRRSKCGSGSRPHVLARCRRRASRRKHVVPPDRELCTSLVISICRGSVAASAISTSMSPASRERDIGQRRKHDGEADDARRARSGLRAPRWPSPAARKQSRSSPLNPLEPETQIVPVAGENIVPGGEAVRGDAIIPALAVEIDVGDALAVRTTASPPGWRRSRHRRAGSRRVDLDAEHDRIEDQRQEKLELASTSYMRLIDGGKVVAGEERLDLFALCLSRRRRV